MTLQFRNSKEFGYKDHDKYANYLIGGSEIVDAIRYSPSSDAWDSSIALGEAYIVNYNSHGVGFSYDGTSIVNDYLDAADDFSDSTMDTVKWSEVVGTVDQSGGSLNILYDPDTMDVPSSIQSAWSFNGDFSLGITLEDVIYYLGSSDDAYCATRLQIMNAHGGTAIWDAAVSINLVYDQSGYYWSVSGSFRDTVYEGYSSGYFDVFSSTDLKVTRSDDTFRFYIDEAELGNGIEASQFSNFSKVRFISDSDGVDSTNYSSFDTFVVNSGNVINKASWSFEPVSFSNRGDSTSFPTHSLLVLNKDSDNYYLDIIDEDKKRLWMRFSGGTNNLFSQGAFGSTFEPFKVKVNYGHIQVPFNSTDTTNFGGVLDIDMTEDFASVRTNYHFEKNEYLGDISQRNSASGWSFETDDTQSGYGFYYDQAPSKIYDFDSSILNYAGDNFLIWMIGYDRGISLWNYHIGGYKVCPLELRDSSTTQIKCASLYDPTGDSLINVFTHPITSGFLFDKFDNDWQKWEEISVIDSINPSSLPSGSGDTLLSLDGTFGNGIIGYFDDVVVDSTRVDNTEVILSLSGNDLSNSGLFDVYVKHMPPDSRSSNVLTLTIT